MFGSRWGVVLCPQVLHRCPQKQSKRQSSRDTARSLLIQPHPRPLSHLGVITHMAPGGHMMDAEETRTDIVTPGCFFLRFRWRRIKWGSFFLLFNDFFSFFRRNLKWCFWRMEKRGQAQAAQLFSFRGGILHDVRYFKAIMLNKWNVWGNAIQLVS